MPQIRFEVDDETHRRFKVLCAQLGKPMAGMLRALVEGLVAPQAQDELMRAAREVNAPPSP
jgi:predicted DNA-binding protein